MSCRFDLDEVKASKQDKFSGFKWAIISQIPAQPNKYYVILFYNFQPENSAWLVTSHILIYAFLSQHFSHPGTPVSTFVHILAKRKIKWYCK